MERKIGEIFEVCGEWYQCVEQPDDYKGCACDICSMNVIGNCELDECSGNYRADKKSVVFKKLEKIGEPITEKGRTFQCLNVPYISCVGCVFNVSKEACYRDRYIDKTCLESEIWVEIKQNKEYMEEKNNNQTEDTPLKRLVSEYINNKIEYSDFEKRVKMLYVDDKGEKLELIPFDLSKAKSGRKLYTRDGKMARIVDFESKGTRPIVALVTEDEEEEPYKYNIDGSYNCSQIQSDYDLFMALEKVEGWININAGIIPYETREEAEKHSKREHRQIKVSWEY